MREFFVYIIANPKRTIYTGVTNNLERRRWEHRERINPGFASEHGCDLLVHAETFANIRDAIIREKEIKGWRRSKKFVLIERENADCDDLSAGW
ncbi:MAG: GIY-YIG nuclease family protein [Thermomicrobiales bacterium]